MKLAMWCLISFCTAATALPSEARPRLLVLTDIGGDPDDQQSMIRLMLYSNEFEIEGLIATASGTPGELKEHVTKPQLIRQIVEAYGRVRSNLVRHADGYPTAQSLLEIIKAGNLQRGLSAIGQGHDTEGSQWIVAAGDKPDSRPLNITIWGGQTDLAQALWRVGQDRGAAGLQKFISKLRVYDVADQDGIGQWIWEQFAGMFYIDAHAPAGRDKREGVFRGMYLGGNESLVSREWMETNIRQGHGPLGALYPDRTWTAPNPHSAIKEGDTPSWFYFLPTGLNDPVHPEWGGWGGRFEKSRDGRYRDAHDTVGAVSDARATVWRWRPAFQADFQARLDWSATDDRANANHAPVAVLNGDRSRGILEIAARAGERVQLNAEGSHDPDGQATLARWFVYPEVGSFRGEVALPASAGTTASFIAPQVANPRTIHVVLQVLDNGMPNLSAFRRAVIAVAPTTSAEEGPVAAQEPQTGWITLFNGQSLDGWTPVDNFGGFEVRDGLLVAGGSKMNHLFYTGPGSAGGLKNFELQAEVKTTRGSNSGIFFHTKPESGFLLTGYEAQIDSTHTDRRRTGSLLDVEDRLETPVKDDEWFSYHILVQGKRIVLKVNDRTTVDYTEPENPKRSERRARRVLSRGAIAVQAHDPQSIVYFRNIRLKSLPD
ncbi:MAG: DUF1593 domain-containing protein [Planctomycetes bacterium]|nr:DUF1593 domain-containing protein [Planctomycetota bacterium]